MQGNVRGKLPSLAIPGNRSPQHPLVSRIRKGQKLEDIHPVAGELPPLQSIDSPFQLQEYLSLLIRLEPYNVDQIVSLPQPMLESSKPFSDGNEKGKARDSNDVTSFPGIEEDAQTVDTDVWIYEQLRRIVLDFSTPWLTMLQKDCDKGKKPKSCEAMNADDWMYLCASHGEEKQCCAIDYIIHTLDGTTALLNSQRHFPSRTYIPNTSLRHFGSVSRRLSRIFVHAFEHHRDVFEACEADTALYARFIALVQTYDLIAVESLPQLGAVGQRVNGKEETEDKDKQQNDVNTHSTIQDNVREVGERRQLFEADIVRPQDEEGSEGEDGVREREGDKESQEESSLERSASNASRVTVVPITQPSPTPQDILGREKAQRHEEMPQDVKDDDEEE